MLGQNIPSQYNLIVRRIYNSVKNRPATPRLETYLTNRVCFRSLMCAEVLVLLEAIIVNQSEDTFYSDCSFVFPFIHRESCVVWSCCTGNAWGVKIGVHYIALGNFANYSLVSTFQADNCSTGECEPYPCCAPSRENVCISRGKWCVPISSTDKQQYHIILHQTYERRFINYNNYTTPLLTTAGYP